MPLKEIGFRQELLTKVRLVGTMVMKSNILPHHASDAVKRKGESDNEKRFMLMGGMHAPADNAVCVM